MPHVLQRRETDLATGLCLAVQEILFMYLTLREIEFAKRWETSAPNIHILSYNCLTVLLA